MSIILQLTGDCSVDKQVVFEAIRNEAEARGLDFDYRPIEDKDHFSFEVKSSRDVVNGVILCSGDRKGSNIWVGMSGTTYTWYVSDQNPNWRKTVIVVDSILKHVIYAPFELLKPEMEPEEGSMQYRFHILDPRSRFTSYATGKRKRSLQNYVDNWSHIFPDGT